MKFVGGEGCGQGSGLMSSPIGCLVTLAYFPSGGEGSKIGNFFVSKWCRIYQNIMQARISHSRMTAQFPNVREILNAHRI